ncbi:MAG: bifunctional hydroxymethylpyrimidine kinase/phosphomethylpyrimidine kinase [Planctomycetaceae bacterium]|nr:bifunctional hydroxymethylpyrimidine kinase/phosphomethylpyrimidine kinase [Planctomycetaceae bacterium]
MIVVAGLSPAWQQILVFDEVSAGEVNRADKAHWCASGKVLNVARAVHALRGEVDTACPVGGPAGDAICDEFDTDGILAMWVPTRSSTRVCTTIIENTTGRVTEFVENARAITANELSEFESVYSQVASEADLCVLTGSLPEVEGQGKPTDLYARLMTASPRVILDVRGPELKAALPHRPLLVKPNREELGMTCGRVLRTDEEALNAMRELNAGGADWVLVTNGTDDVLLTNKSAVWRFSVPSVEVRNPIGCGDCLAAGIAVALSDGTDMIEAVRFGIAAAAQNATDILPARFDRTAVNELTHMVNVRSC